MANSSVVINITPEDYAKLFHWAKLAISPDTNSPMEIGGYGLYDPNRGLIHSLILIEQTAGTGDVDFKMEDLAPYIASSKKPEQYRVWWHSHGSSKAFVSGTDQEHIDDWGKAVDYLISIVVNFAGECICRVNYFRPVACHIGVELRPDFTLSQKTQMSMASEVLSKVKFRKPVAVQTSVLNGSKSTQESLFHYLNNERKLSLPKPLKKFLKRNKGVPDLDALITQDTLMSEFFGKDYQVFRKLPIWLKRQH
jgi:hypothetical protein